MFFYIYVMGMFGNNNIQTYSKNKWWLAICLIVIFCGFQHRATTSNQPLSPADYPFYIYNFGGLTNYTISNQVKMLANLGYNGMAIQATTEEDVQGLPEYLNSAATRKNFKIYAVFVRYNFTDADIDKNRWKEVVDLIAGKQISLWLIFGKKIAGITDNDVDKVLKEVTDYASLKNVPVTLYPHSTCYIETAEQALPFVIRNHSSNLKLAVHLCHEIRYGNGGRLIEVLKNVRPYIGYVTLSGTDSVANFKSPLSMDTSTIKPLYRGNYDLRIFLTSLKSVHYTGPIGFINFKITDDVPTYLNLSIVTWNKLKKEILN